MPFRFWQIADDRRYCRRKWQNSRSINPTRFANRPVTRTSVIVPPFHFPFDPSANQSYLPDYAISARSSLVAIAVPLLVRERTRAGVKNTRSHFKRWRTFIKKSFRFPIFDFICVPLFTILSFFILVLVEKLIFTRVKNSSIFRQKFRVTFVTKFSIFSRGGEIKFKHFSSHSISIDVERSEKE